MEKMLRVFEISRMTNHNGPGIRTLVHFKRLSVAMSVVFNTGIASRQDRTFAKTGKVHWMWRMYRKL